MLRLLIGLLLLFWIIGFVLDIVGGLIHILLVLAIIAFIYHMVAGRKNGS